MFILWQHTSVTKSPIDTYIFMVVPCYISLDDLKDICYGFENWLYHHRISTITYMYSPAAHGGRPLPMGGYTDKIACNIHGKERLSIYIVACQRGGVSNKPPGLRTATTILVIATYKKIKQQKRTDRTFDPFLLRQDDPGTSQYISYILDNIPAPLAVAAPHGQLASFSL